MIRRDFLATGIASGAALMGASQAKGNAAKFKLKYGPHPNMFKHNAGDSIIDQMQFASDQGFTAWEDNRAMRHEVSLQNQIGKKIEQTGMTMGVFVSHAEFNNTDFVSKTDKDYQDSLRATMRKAVETAKRVNTKWTTVVPAGVNLKLDPGFQRANCIENLKVCAEICEPSGLVMVLEPLNWYANHPGAFLRGVPQAYAICKGVNSPSCKILDDLYHQQIDIGNLIPNMEMAWDEIDYIQVGDNPGRKEPTTGEINYKNIFKWLYDRKCDLVIGMEHGNSKPGKDGEMAVIAAYRECDSY